MIAPVSDQFVLVLWMLVKVVIFAMLLERGLYFIFDYTLWRDRIEGRGIKAPVALGAAWAICWWYDFDVLAVLLDPEANATDLGIFITATIVAGGSAGAIVLFQDVLKFTRSARADIQALQKQRQEVEKAELQARKVRAERG